MRNQMLNNSITAETAGKTARTKLRKQGFNRRKKGNKNRN